MIAAGGEEAEASHAQCMFPETILVIAAGQCFLDHTDVVAAAVREMEDAIFSPVLNCVFERSRNILLGAITCGDADTSGSVNISDAVFLIQYIFAGGPPPNPLEAGDADCSGGINMSDVVYLIQYIFAEGPAPCDPNDDGIPDC